MALIDKRMEDQFECTGVTIVAFRHRDEVYGRGLRSTDMGIDRCTWP